MSELEKDRRVRHLEAKSFRIIFDFIGLNNKNIQEIAKLAVSNSEIRLTHEISYWKISSRDQGCGIIILRGKKKWRKQHFPNFSFKLNNQFVRPSAEVFTITEFKKRKTSIELNSDFILKDFTPLPWKSCQRKKIISPKSRSKSIEKAKITEYMNNQFQKQIKNSLNEFGSESNEDDSNLSIEIAKVIQSKKKKTKTFIKDLLNGIEKFDSDNQSIQDLNELNEISLESLTNDEVDQSLKLSTNDFFLKENNLSFQQKRLLNLLGENISLAIFQYLIQLFQERYENNQNIGILGDQLLSSLVLANVREVEIQIKQAKQMRQNYFMLPFFYDNHGSILIFSPEYNTIFHIDSKMKFKTHIQILKPKLLGMLQKFKTEYDGRKYEIEDEEEMWDSIQIIECPEQSTDSQSSIYCLKNIHEFLIQDKIYFDLQKKYSKNDLLNYLSFIKTCLIENQIVNYR